MKRSMLVFSAVVMFFSYSPLRADDGPTPGQVVGAKNSTDKATDPKIIAVRKDFANTEKTAKENVKAVETKFGPKSPEADQARVEAKKTIKEARETELLKIHEIRKADHPK